MLIEIVKFTDGNFSRVKVNSEDITFKRLQAPGILAYRLISDDGNEDKDTDIYDWNLSSELKSLIRPLPKKLTPEILYMFNGNFLSTAVDIFEAAKSNSGMDDSEVSNAICRLCCIWGKIAVLFDKDISEILDNLPKD